MTNPFTEYRITSPYGPRKSPISGAQEWHTGIDLVKAHRDPIYSFVAGEVIFASEGKSGSGFGGYGIVVAVRCPKTGHLHVYAHLDAAVVKVGQQVERGQMIGRQGNTGQSTGSHLHYEIRKSSSPQYGWIADRVNNCFEPTKYLQDLYAAEEKENPNMHNVSTYKQWEWKMLGDSLDGLYRKGIISDYTWAEKAYKGQLTQEELSWLNMVTFARQNGIEV